MNVLTPPDTIVTDVLVPVLLLARPDGFGGTRLGDCLRGDLVIRRGRAVGLQPCTADVAPRGMVLPGLTECHVHLDKCHTVSRMHGVGGDLQAAVEMQRDILPGNWRPDIQHLADTAMGIGFHLLIPHFAVQ